MRRTPVLLALTALVAAGLVGCSSAADASCTRPADATGLLDLVDVSGDVATAPDATVRAPFHVSDTQVAEAVTGGGTALTTDTQLALVDMTVFSGESGESLVSTRYSDDVAQIPSVSQLSATFPTLPADLQCATEGSRVVVGLAAQDIPEQTATELSLEEGESLVLVTDVRKVYLPKADGADQFSESHGLPTVVRAPDGRPGIIVPDATAPTETVVQTLKRGDGAEVDGDAPVRVAYTGLVWDTRKVFDSTWGKQPVSITVDGVVPGFAEALQGQTVGSQVLVVVPPDQGYGDQAQGAIPAGSTLVFVIDILGIDD